MTDIVHLPPIDLAPPTGGPAVLELLTALRRHWLLFAAVTIVVAGCGTAVVLQLPASYTATATVSVRPDGADPLVAGSNRPGALDDDAVETQADTLRSREPARAVVEALDIGSAPAAPSPLRSAVHEAACRWVPELVRCAGPAPAPSLAGRIDGFLHNLAVVSNGRSRVLTVSYSSPDPAQAAAAANMMVTEVQKQQVASKAQDLQRTADWLDSRASDLRDRVASAEAKAGSFRASSGLNERATTGGTVPLVADQIAGASNDYSQAQVQQAVAEARVSALAGVQGNPQRALTLTDQPLVVAAATTLSALYSQRASLAQSFGERYPPLVALNGQIKEAQAKLGAEVARAVAALNADVAVKRAQTARLAANLSALRTEGNSAAGPMVRQRALDREASSASTLYLTFQERAREISDRSALLTPSVQFVSHAEVPEGPSFPRTGRLLGGVAALGLVAGAGAAFARYFLSGEATVGNRTDAVLGLPLLASVPAVSLASRMRVPLARYVARHPFSPTGEAIRALASRLTLAGSGRAGSVLVTSATVEEGKSTVCLWLAEAVARTGQRVLLIDGDHRRGTLHKSLNARPGPGLTDWLTGRSTLAQIVQLDVVAGVDFIPAGKPMARPFSAGELDRLKAVLDRLNDGYGAMVIDAPPLLGMVDGLLYAHAADHTVMACRWGRTTEAAVRACVDRLRNVGANIAGVVFTMVDPTPEARYGQGATRRDMKLLSRAYGG